MAASATALGRLAEALRLNAAERASLFDLAGKRDPAALPDSQTDLLPGLLALPALISAPAYLLDHAWTARAWNAAAAKLFVGWLDKKAEDRNLLRFVFLSREARALIADWPERARRIVAEFRADYNRRPWDETMQILVDELSTQSASFLEHWRDQAVLHREGGERKFHHPTQGELRYVQTTLLVALQQELKLVCLVPLPADAR